ncbi:hypothetical protein ACB098_09G028900 [Castanea mollissima]
MKKTVESVKKVISFFDYESSWLGCTGCFCFSFPKAKTVMDGNRIACEKSKAKRSAESVCINGSDGLSVTVTFPTSALTTTKQKQKQKTRKGLPVRVCFFFFFGI